MSIDRLILPFLAALSFALGAQATPARASAHAPPQAKTRLYFRPAEITGVINLNSATDTELRTLPGIGPAKAQRIVAQRAAHKFTSVDQIMRVKGIGRKTFRKLKAHLAVSGPTTLKKLPRTKPQEQALLDEHDLPATELPPGKPEEPRGQ